MDEKSRRGEGNGSDAGAMRPGGHMAAAAADQRSSFYERAARRIGERGGGFGPGGYGRYGSAPDARGQGFDRPRWSPATQESGREAEHPSFGRGESAWGGQFGGEVHAHDRGREREAQPTRGRERHGRWQREAITAGEIMTSGPRAARRENTLQEIAQVMKDESCGVVPVVDDQGRLVGMVTDRDLVVRAATHNRNFAETRASDVMTDDVEAVTPDEEVRDVIDLMAEKQVRRIPVVDRDDRLMGIISMGDIANRADYDEELQEALERISSKRSFWSRLWR
jgi:CBS domain-containing protein